jgi:hemolysin activation/secretion protein
MSLRIPKRKGDAMRASFWALVLGCGALAAHAQVPPSAAPGANQPLPPAIPIEKRLPSPELLSVPPVADRPVGMEEGPRVIVSQFTLVGAKDHPKQKLRLTDMQWLLTRALVLQPAQGFTVNQLQAVADSVRALYRDKGFILTQAFVPAQSIVKGVVQIQVLEGKLGAVRVVDNKHYRTSTLTSGFTSAIGETVNENEMDVRILRLSSYPGLSVFGVFTPGTEEGASDLVLKVQREKPVDFTIGADNYGNPSGGEYRAHAGIAWNDPLGIGDVLQLYGLEAFPVSSDRFSGAKTTYGSGAYALPLFSGQAALSVAYNSNRYTPGGQALSSLTGDGSDANLELDVDLLRSRAGRLYVYGRGDYKQAKLNEPVPIGTVEEKLAEGTVGVHFDHTDGGARGQWVGYLEFADGSNSRSGVETIRIVSDSSYNLERFNLERIQGLTAFQFLHFKVAGQHTSDALPSLDQSSLGGPASVRAYAVADYVADKSLIATAEYYFPIPGLTSRAGPGGTPWGRLLQIRLFYDYGHGQLNKTLPGEFPSLTMQGYGGGIQVNASNHLLFNFDVAAPVDASTADRSVLGYKSVRIFAGLNLTF